MRKKKILMMLALLTTATAWADDVNLTEDTGETAGTAARWYVNMPATGTNTLTLSDATVTTFKVYDDGGSTGNYSNKCSGTLVLTAPEGYLLQLSGSITTETIDKLTVYDNSEASGTTLLNGVRSTRNGTATTITTVTSSGQSMTLYFYSDNSTNYAGLDLTVTLISTSTKYAITVDTATGGSIAATVGGSSAATAKYNDVVTLTATPSDGYLLSNLSVTDVNSNAIAVTDMLWYTNTTTATFTMPVSAVTVTPTFTNTLTADGGLYINMPATDTKTVTIPSGVTSFKVYDDGGASGNYSNSCSGTLVLTAPEGYVLQLSGSITTESYLDELTVYNGSEASGTKLIDAVSSTRTSTQPAITTAITTVTSSGQSMTLYFHSNSSNYYAGLDLTVTLISTSTERAITVNTATGGSIAATVGGSSAATAKYNDVVTLTATPSDGYLLSNLSVTDVNSNAIAVTDMLWYTNTTTATFTMPVSAVTVTPTFTNTLTADGGLYINMPATDTKTVTIPSDVTSFKVYDDGGASGNYSYSCSGYLVLTAPEGYVLQLSGSISTETNCDKLTVYDNSEASGATLLNGVSSGTATTITTVTSSGQSMTLYFSSDDSGNYEGLDLTVTVVPIEYTIIDGGLYINMPATGSKHATIPSSVQSFKVYDDGGASGNYSDNCNGILVLTAPEGYVLQLSGSITTEKGFDRLTVYDNSAANGTKLLDSVSSSESGTATDITTVVSSGQSMTLYFYTGGSTNYAGLDLTVTLVKQVTLADNADNASAISEANNQRASVTLSGRTLYKDGAWNTICLPFDVTIAGSPLAGATARALESASISGTTLTLTFGDAVTTLEAGTPYIIKWASGDNIVSPVFSGVTIDKTDRSYDNGISGDNRVRFLGTYKSTTFDAEDKSILFMGDGNKLYYPETGAGIGAQRAYFKIGDGAALARQLTAFRINFGEDEATGIISLSTDSKDSKDNAAWYSLDGRKLQGKPSRAGVYINNGIKIVIK